MENITIDIEGMSCMHCVKAVEMEFKNLNLGSYKVEIGKAEVEYNPNVVNKSKIYAAIEEAGFKVKE